MIKSFETQFEWSLKIKPLTIQRTHEESLYMYT